VAREGLETALFLFAGAQSSGETGATPLVGALLGIATAVVIGLLLYRGALKLNLSSLFMWTGALLVVIAAGVLRYGVHELQETGVLPGKDNYVLDLTGSVDPAGLDRLPGSGLLQRGAGHDGAGDHCLGPVHRDRDAAVLLGDQAQ
jgi:high-affinity iron transporter